MPVSRAKPIAQRVVRRVFVGRTGTEIYACSRHAFAETGWDFEFTSRLGSVTCRSGGPRPRAQIVVRYDAFNTGCGDF